MKKLKLMNIYIDGSCRPTTKLGAFAVLIIDSKGNKTVLSGKRENVTNNIMELEALIAALENIKAEKLDKDNVIEIFSDSQYVVKGVNEWWTKWKANNYKTSTGLVKNLELWKRLEKLCKEVVCTLTWIKGHADNERHNEVDAIVFNLTDPINQPPVEIVVG